MRGFVSWGFVIVIAIVALVIYAAINFSKSGNFLGKTGYQTVNLVELLSFANLYNGKKICTRGYYVGNDRLSIIKVDLRENQFTRSSWVDFAKGEIITVVGGIERAIDAEVCGRFQFGRGGQFGNPPFWNHQITVDSYKTFGDVFEVSLP